MNDKNYTIAEDKAELAEILESELLNSLRDRLPQSLNTGFVLSAKHSDGTVIGGITASTSYSWLLIKLLWVDEEYRHLGIGHSLMKRCEDKGSKLGCHSAWLDTSNPDAMSFYSKLGYETFGELANSSRQDPPDHNRWFMKKSL